MSEQNDTTRFITVNIDEQMRSAYIDYSMSVIVSRALPDVRDGLKPVHRRVLFGMQDMGITPSSSYKKSARIVGEVMGKYHPHGDSSVYDTMVRMAQEWSLRYTLVDGQGNFGSVDGDSPAAMRYTEARFSKISMEMLKDIEKDTVDFRLNFDDSLKEPTVLPATFPNLLVNGAAGIAVGMATNMPPHNLTEVVDGVIACIDNPEISIEELMQYIKGPDFPTGATIYGTEGIYNAYTTGKGRVVIRSKYHLEEVKEREQIVFTEIPYMVNKAELIKKIADLVNDKVIDGISNIRDESDRKGMRIVFILKTDAIPEIVVNTLFKSTALQSSFSINNVALVNGKPQTLGVKELITHFIAHRHEIVVRKTKFELAKAEAEAHILEGLMIALDHIDEIIALIKSSDNVESARNALMKNYSLSERQAKSILELRLQKLTGLEREKLKAEYEALLSLIKELKEILESKDIRMSIIKEDLLGIKERFGDVRKSEIVESTADVSIEDLIPDSEVVITISKAGYIKRTLLSEFKTQSRGGTGMKGATTRVHDELEHIFISTNHAYILLFTELGKCFWIKTYEIPEGQKSGKGRVIQNLMNIDKEDNILTFIHTKNLKDTEYLKNNFIVMVTKNGIIKKSSLEDYSRPRQNGINAITIKDNDRLLEARMTDGNSQIMLAAKKGKAVRFDEDQIRPMGRTASGVKGINLSGKDDEVIGMLCVNKDETQNYSIMVVSEKGYGKRSNIEDYRITKRGAKGVKTINITPKTGDLFAIKEVSDDYDVLIITKAGTTIRMSAVDMRIMGKATQGVRLINLRTKDSIASVTRIIKSPEDEKEISEEENAEGNIE